MAWRNCAAVAVFVGATMVLSTGPARAATFVLNFDTDPIGNPIEAGTIVDALYEVLGVTFQHEGATSCGTHVYASADQPAGFGSPPNVVSTCEPPAASSMSSDAQGVIRAILHQPASRVCVDVRPDGPAAFATLRVFDAGGAQIGSASSTPGATGPLCAEATAIRGARLAGGSAQASARFDNFAVTFSSGPCDPQAPPLPALHALDAVPGLVAAVLPSSRSVQVGATATAFATVINPRPEMACGVGIALPAGVGAFAYRQTDCTSNVVVGAENTPVNIAPGGRACYVIALTPGGPFAPAELGFNYSGANAAPVAELNGINTLLFSASTDPVPDMIAIAATIQGDGIVHVPAATRIGAFAVATSNVGVGARIVVSANTAGAPLPLSIALCESNPATSQCISPLGPTVTTDVPAGGTPTFAIFVTATAPIAFEPGTRRIFVVFADEGGVVRGRTSVAVEAQ